MAILTPQISLSCSYLFMKFQILFSCLLMLYCVKFTHVILGLSVKLLSSAVIVSLNQFVIYMNA